MRLLSCATLAAVIAGGAAVAQQRDVTGELTYRERVALPDGGVHGLTKGGGLGGGDHQGGVAGSAAHEPAQPDAERHQQQGADGADDERLVGELHHDFAARDDEPSRLSASYLFRKLRWLDPSRGPRRGGHGAVTSR